MGDIDPKILDAARVWDAIARMHGYNEMTKLAGTLGEKVYCRMACDSACEEAVSLGASITRTETGGTVLFSIDEVSPSIKFRESDIEKMREVVRNFDAEPTRSRLAAEARDTCLPQTPGNEAERLSVEIPTSGNCEPRGDGGERPATTPDWRALLANLVEALPRCSQCRDVATSAKYDEGPFACEDHYLFEEYGHFDYTTPLRAACKALEDHHA